MSRASKQAKEMLKEYKRLYPPPYRAVTYYVAGHTDLAAEFDPDIRGQLFYSFTMLRTVFRDRCHATGRFMITLIAGEDKPGEKAPAIIVDTALLDRACNG